MPFDVYLHQRNREADRVELSAEALEHSRLLDEGAEPARARMPRLEPVHTETVVHVEHRVVVTSHAATGRLIDLLL